MWNESPDPKKGEQPPALKTGLTTGSCATACSVAAAIYLFTQALPKVVSITLPNNKSTKRKNKTVELFIKDYQQTAKGIYVSTTKNAGDDPDVTHGATVFVELVLKATAGIEFKAAKGVGTVTREGLLLSVGEPAINPIPRKMITEHLNAFAKKYHYCGGFVVAIGIKNGAAIAQKTMNPRLGILGGLSILGTTGIVRPFSCAAWIASIYQGIDVAAANGCQHIAATTGNSSEAAIKAYYRLSDMALIEMGDFAGAVLKHLKRVDTEAQNPVAINKLSICGGLGKISKLAQGHMDLNSRASSIDFEHLTLSAKNLGASDALCEKIKYSNTSIEALQHCQKDNIDLAYSLCEQALKVAKNILPNSIWVEVIAIDRQGNFVAKAVESRAVNNRREHK